MPPPEFFKLRADTACLSRSQSRSLHHKTWNDTVWKHTLMEWFSPKPLHVSASRVHIPIHSFWRLFKFEVQYPTYELIWSLNDTMIWNAFALLEQTVTPIFLTHMTCFCNVLMFTCDWLHTFKSEWYVTTPLSPHLHTWLATRVTGWLIRYDPKIFTCRIVTCSKLGEPKCSRVVSWESELYDTHPNSHVSHTRVRNELSDTPPKFLRAACTH